MDELLTIYKDRLSIMCILCSRIHLFPENVAPKKQIIYREIWSRTTSRIKVLGGLVFKAHRLLYHSTLGVGVIKKRRSKDAGTLQSDRYSSSAGNVFGYQNIRHSSQFKNNHFTEMCCGTEAGSYVRLEDSFITQLKAQGPSRTCNESREEEEEDIKISNKDSGALDTTQERLVVQFGLRVYHQQPDVNYIQVLEKGRFPLHGTRCTVQGKSIEG